MLYLLLQIGVGVYYAIYHGFSDIDTCHEAMITKSHNSSNLEHIIIVSNC